MPFQPVWLLTDLLIYLLIAAFFLALVYALKREHLRAPLRQVRKKPMAMAALMVLLGYLAIGLSDSFHFRSLRGGGERTAPVGRGGEGSIVTDDETGGSSGDLIYSPEVLSLLDLLVGPLRTNVEKSYSAPLAIHAFAKETMEDDHGQKNRIFPRLLYGGNQIKSAEDHASDVYYTGVCGIVQGLITGFLLSVIGIFVMSRVHHDSMSNTMLGVLRGRYDTAWGSIFLTGSLILVVGWMMVSLSSRYHILGTDKVGQDVLYLSLKSVRTGLVIGTLTTLIMLPFAVFLGILAGYCKGKIDEAIQFLYTTLSSVPGVLLVAAAILMLEMYMDTHADAFVTSAERADARLFFLCLILGTTGWIGLCRLLRGETLKLSELEYVQAAVALGVGHGKILLRHILPNVMHIILISAVLDFSGLVLAEAVLSYVGIGVDPAMISWGNMINSARLEMAREPIVWWPLVAAFVSMFGLVLSANIVSDAVRDGFDPRLRSR